ncbi:MAG: dephospho-CoA kinase [Ignavibacteriales bacterium]|nr:dephospho-CoA kinase [Ignavibacteriales bacterium]
MKRKIGITGGIGTGKSLVAKFYQEKGYPTINADEVAKEISSSNLKIKNKIIKTFGVESYIQDKINTQYLANIVFPNPENLKKLNSIVHPPLKEHLKKMMNDKLVNSDIIFVEAALIYEAKFDDLFDYILLITSNLDLRIDRVLQRDKTNKEQILARIEDQIPEENLREKADFIIENNSTISELNKKADFLLSIFKTI